MAVKTIEYVVGNTYHRRSDREAKLDRSGRYPKVHDWTLYVDVLPGSSPDLLERVSFDLGPSFRPASFVCSCPVQITRPNGSEAWRFSTRQQTYGANTAVIKLRGMGGTANSFEYTTILNETANTQKHSVRSFKETRSLRPFKMLKLPENQNFGIELELTSASHVRIDEISSRLSMAVGTVDVATSYGARDSYGGWKLVPDSSVICSRSEPDCDTFEVVSPILQGGNGLSVVSRAIQALKQIQPGLRVNKSMGFHVHVDVSKLSLSQVIKVCQNFIKYEDVMDEFIPLSRRNESPESERYFQSNRSRVPGMTNRQRHARLAACSDIGSLAFAMNGESQYHKLNLQNLVSGRQPTIEFRQHSATINYEKISAWVRFCVALVTQSARLAPPSQLAERRSTAQQFHGLFHFVIKDRGLSDFYHNRREELAGCCEVCVMDGGCLCSSAARSGSVRKDAPLFGGGALLVCQSYPKRRKYA